MDKRCGLVLGMLCFFTGSLMAQDLPPDELQVNVSGYFDSFDVSVVYPSIALTRRVSESTSLTGRYLVDMVTAASISGSNTTTGEDDDEREEDGREGRRVDTVTSASQRRSAVAALPSFDDVRHEVNIGLTHLLGRNTALSLNGLYSHENDYASTTVAGTLTQAFAKKNTTVQLGFVHSWDKVFPVTKDWTRSKNVTTFSASMSQLLGKRLIAQLLYSYTLNTGHLSDDYKLVTIAGTLYDPVHPDRRIRQAASARFNYRLNDKSALQVGYRYYWDTWNVDSHTLSGLYQRHLSPVVTIGLGFRSYVQSRAYFFQPTYSEPVAFMTADNKLDAGTSTEAQFKLTLNGGKGRQRVPLLSDDRLQYILSLNIYRRRTDTPDWYSGKTTLWASYFNAGIRFRF